MRYSTFSRPSNNNLKNQTESNATEFFAKGGSNRHRRSFACQQWARNLPAYRPSCSMYCIEVFDSLLWQQLLQNFTKALVSVGEVEAFRKGKSLCTACRLYIAILHVRNKIKSGLLTHNDQLDCEVPKGG